MKHHLLRQIGLIILVFVLVLSATYGLVRVYEYMRHGHVATRTPVSGGNVVLTPGGFTPQILTLSIGSTVIFRSQAGKDFWPASDLHPTHQIYPEFDPKRALSPGEAWSFTFTKPGTWKYHDHLNPLATGVIIVESAGGSVSDVDCTQNSQQTTCFEQLMDDILRSKGLDAAFETMARLYTTEPVFASECHAYAHKLGQAAYKEYSATGKAPLSPKASYCGYGFYHGFLETLLHTSGDIREAQDFCAYAGRELATETSDAEGACYHGIGHGVVDGSDPTAWGNIDKVLKPGMDICQQVAGEDRAQYGKLYRCVSGAYNALEIVSTDPKYKLGDIVSNPFGLCTSQPAEFYEACYTNMLPAQMRLRNNNFVQLSKDVQAISVATTELVRGPVLSSLWHEYIRIHLTDAGYAVGQAVANCSRLGELRLYCIDGLAGGHMKYGKPREEYIQGLAFCGSSPLLRADEQDRCYAYILPRLRIWYTEEKKTSICNSVPAAYKKYCSA